MNERQLRAVRWIQQTDAEGLRLLLGDAALSVAAEVLDAMGRLPPPAPDATADMIGATAAKIGDVSARLVQEARLRPHGFAREGEKEGSVLLAGVCLLLTVAARPLAGERPADIRERIELIADAVAAVYPAATYLSQKKESGWTPSFFGVRYSRGDE